MLHHSLVARIASLALATLLCAPLSATTIYVLSTENKLVAFDSATPGIRAFSSIPADGVLVTGLQPAESLVSIDFRPSTGQLYGLGSTMRLYKIDIQLNMDAPPATAVATAGSATSVKTPIVAKYGMDFNPVVDRVRVVNENEENFRINPFNGALSGSDTNLTPPGGIVDVAYDRSFPGSTSSTAFAIDAESDSLKRLGGVNGIPSPNAGLLTEIGPLGFDIPANSAIDFGAGTTLFAAFRSGGSATGLYTINTATGAATLVGVIDGNPLVQGIAVTSQLAIAKKMSIKLNFAKVDSDAINVSGTLDVPSTYFDSAPVQATAKVSIGGIVRNFELDEKGRGVSGSDKITVAISLKNGTPTGTFKISLKKGNFAALLADEGLVNSDVSAVPVHVPLSIYVNSTQFVTSANVVQIYSAKTGKTGKTK